MTERKSISWTKDEWAELLTNECHMRRDKANQMAAQLAEQDFFKDVDIYPFIAALRRHGAKSAEQETQTTGLDYNKRRLCNELMCEVCKDIPVFDAPAAKILLTSFNIHTYLEERYRKKLVYRDAIAFIKSKLDEDIELTIRIDKTCHKGVRRLVHQQHQSANVFELRTNHLRLRVYANAKLHSYTVCRIVEEQFGNAHVQYFVHLLAPLIRPVALKLSNFPNAHSALCAVNSLACCVDWGIMFAGQFLAMPNTALARFTKLAIWLMDDLDLDQWSQFCGAFIRWLTADGQSKKCISSCFDQQKLNIFLDAIKADFFRANSQRGPFAVHFFTSAENLEPFRVYNNVGEQLQLRREFFGTDGDHHIYALIRRPISVPDQYRIELTDFGKFPDLAEITCITYS